MPRLLHKDSYTRRSLSFALVFDFAISGQGRADAKISIMTPPPTWSPSRRKLAATKLTLDPSIAGYQDPHFVDLSPAFFEALHGRAANSRRPRT